MTYELTEDDYKVIEVTTTGLSPHEKQSVVMIHKRQIELAQKELEETRNLVTGLERIVALRTEILKRLLP